MKKLKLYLDISVISHLKHDEVPDKMADTLQLWEEIKAGVYDVYLSNVTLDEINQCSEPKKSILNEHLAMIDYQLIELDAEIQEIAEKFVQNKILTIKSLDDCRHIACAIANECDIIISWNFKHIVNYKTMNGVKLISAITGYKEVMIQKPTILISKED